MRWIDFLHEKNECGSMWSLTFWPIAMTLAIGKDNDMHYFYPQIQLWRFYAGGKVGYVYG